MADNSSDLFTQAYNDVFGSPTVISAADSVPTATPILTSDNSGTTIDLSQGVSNGQPTSNLTGNSLLDSIAKLSAFATSTVNAGLSVYSSFLNTEKTIKAGQTTPGSTTVTGANPTVPLTAAQQSRNNIVYFGIGIAAVFILTKLLKK